MHDKIAMGALMYFVMPLWLIAGFADYLCHRARRIEFSSGARESAIHLLSFALMGVPMLAAVFLEVNAAVLAIMAVALVLHEGTTLWDLSYAQRTRGIGWVEQHVHSFLEMIPVLGLSLMVVLHWEQAFAIFGAGPHLPDWTLRLKYEPLPVPYVAIALIAALLIDLLPFVEELWRGIQARRRRRLAAAE